MLKSDFFEPAQGFDFDSIYQEEEPSGYFVQFHPRIATSPGSRYI
jgi:hypothetical protein